MPVACAKKRAQFELSPRRTMSPLLKHFFAVQIVVLGAAAPLPGRADEGNRLIVQPDRIELRGADDRHGILVTRVEPDGRTIDVTRQSTFTSSMPAVVTVDKDGQCHATGDGAGEIQVSCGGQIAAVPVTTSNTVNSRVPSFRQDIEPILTKAGCNSGGCHGKLIGQNGFRLSLRGFAPEWDHDWLANEVNGRRINIAFPGQSLLVQKPVGDVVHEGGTKFRADSRFYQTLIDWIAARAPGPIAEEADAIRLEVFPGDREMRPGDKQQLLVRAHYGNGRVRDVTWLAQFFSNDESIAAVKPDGVVKALRAGETSVRIHFQSQVAVVRFTMPFAGEVAETDFTRRQNVLDEPIFKKLRALRIAPSGGCDDTTFIRRASLDTIGTLPAAEEVSRFLADNRPDKRARLVDALLERPEYVDYWSLQLADLLQNRRERDHDVRGTKGVRSFHAWVRAQLAANRSWKEIAQSVLLATGDVGTNPAVGYYVTLVGEKQHVEESELPDSIAQCFLGTRIGCARCHNHPLEKFTQDDFYHFAAYFSKLTLKREKSETGATVLSTVTSDETGQRGRVDELEAGLDDAQSVAGSIGEEPGREEAQKEVAERKKQLDEGRKRLAEIVNKQPGVNQPRTGKLMIPRTLDGTSPSSPPGGDLREALVAALFKSENFSGAMVNRLWKHFFNVALVEPVDDLRASNPPSNAELWALLNREFVEHDYDLKYLMRVILGSRAYQLGSETVAGNEIDKKFYSHYYARRLPAEVLIDAIASATDVPTKFDGHPLGVRAIQLPDPQVGSYFLTLFGRSDRVTACACERQGEVTLPQLLHLHNSGEIQRQIGAADGRLATLIKNPDDKAVTAAIFLASASRYPTEKEVDTVTKALIEGGRDAVFKDLLWALLNSKEFAFNH